MAGAEATYVFLRSGTYYKDVTVEDAAASEGEDDDTATINAGVSGARGAGDEADSRAPLAVPLGGEAIFIWGGSGDVTAEAADTSVVGVVVEGLAIRVTGLVVGETEQPRDVLLPRDRPTSYRRTIPGGDRLSRKRPGSPRDEAARQRRTWATVAYAPSAQVRSGTIGVFGSHHSRKNTRKPKGTFLLCVDTVHAVRFQHGGLTVRIAFRYRHGPSMTTLQ